MTPPKRPSLAALRRQVNDWNTAHPLPGLSIKLHAMLNVLEDMPSSPEKRQPLILVGETAEILETQLQD